MTTVVLKEVTGTVTDAANTTITIPKTATHVAIQVDESANAAVTVSVGGGLFSAVDFTNANPAHTASFSGPIAAINIAASGADVDYAITCIGEG